MIPVQIVYELRVIRIDQAHRGDGIKRWLRNSAGWYEGETLALEGIAPIRCSGPLSRRMAEWPNTLVAGLKTNSAMNLG